MQQTSRPAECQEVLAIVCVLNPSCYANMHITAFEYQKKFNSLLELGECPKREVATNVSGKLMYSTLHCPVSQAGTVTHTRLTVNDSRNVLIENPAQIVAYIPLCGGEAASFLGILNHGDCVAVEIASKLVFSEKTLVRAYVGYYQESSDVLEPAKINSRFMEESRESVYEGNYYLKNRSYGTIEIIFVHFRFASVNEKLRAASIKLSYSNLMSDYMKNMKYQNLTPTKTTVISLSTSKFDTYYTRHFTADNFSRAIRNVEIDEMEIRKRFEDINARVLVPHLSYDFFPFIESDKATLRSANPLVWEETSMLEIQIRQAINKAKKNVNLCRQQTIKPCERIRRMLESLREFHKEFHSGRANWVNLSIEEKNAFTTRYSARVKSFLSIIDRITKEVKKENLNKKLDKTKKPESQNSTSLTSNEISKTSKKNKRKHPIRHERHRAEALKRRQ